MKRIMLLAVIAGALAVPATAGASNGLGAGGVAACAGAYDTPVGEWAPVIQLEAYPGPPGPFGGPNSRIDWEFGKNNGTDLIAFCTS